VLPDGAVFDEQTHSRLGDRGLDEVLACLWPGDCQTCGDSLRGGSPALVVDELDVLTRASLHHRRCWAPEWNDSLVIRTSGTALLSWRTVVALLPFDDGGREIHAAGLVVNPVGLEYSIVVLACLFRWRRAACQAAIWYSCVRPPRTCFRRIWCSARLISGGRQCA
jgi:hypothetical protein